MPSVVCTICSECLELDHQVVSACPCGHVYHEHDKCEWDFQSIQYLKDIQDFQEEETPVLGQPVTSKMLLSHLLFLSLVCVTINGQACPIAPKAGAITTNTKADTPTTKAGATTTKAGATTTKAGATTTKAGATTTKAGATTTKAVATNSKAGATTINKAGATTTKAGATTTNKAGATTTNKAGATTTNKAGATTAKAGACSIMSIVNGILRDCTAIYKAGCNKSGIYNITPNGWTEGPFEAYCDMETVIVPNLKLCYLHGWTVFQRRVNGSVDFNRNWASYKDGFGQLDHEFWLGNEKLHYLTKNKDYRLQIQFVSSSGTTYHACYLKFHIKEEGEKYELHASKFHDTNSLSDDLSDQNGKAFSTYDRDNTESTNNCADITQGGWWHKTCHGYDTNLNGVYGSNQDSTSIYWKGLPNGESIISSEMKIRRCIICD
ncbi:fibrinogen-related protein 4 [Apostichopus japonicus]|uniref:Fibrinogen-related protein 4 n=1 Tax=Stichopus japonicus TaxID=307972 RepID=A0A2G8KMY5_STIJA|nr:fibrinogen-related protein 4 [Apostichopus japonicus]